MLLRVILLRRRIIELVVIAVDIVVLLDLVHRLLQLYDEEHEPIIPVFN